jgi:hypothetical protein
VLNLIVNKILGRKKWRKKIIVVIPVNNKQIYVIMWFVQQGVAKNQMPPGVAQRLFHFFIYNARFLQILQRFFL